MRDKKSLYFITHLFSFYVWLRTWVLAFTGTFLMHDSSWNCRMQMVCSELTLMYVSGHKTPDVMIWYIYYIFKAYMRETKNIGSYFGQCVFL